MHLFKRFRIYLGFLLTIGLAFPAGLLLTDNNLPSVSEFTVQVEVHPDFIRDQESRLATYSDITSAYATALEELPGAVMERVRSGLSESEVLSLSANDFSASIGRGVLGSFAITFVDSPGLIDVTLKQLEAHLAELLEAYEFQPVALTNIAVETVPQEGFIGWQFGLLLAAGAGLIYSLVTVARQAVLAYQSKAQRNVA
jgi:hypothetical protein